jgi:hypothetical protein
MLSLFMSSSLLSVMTISILVQRTVACWHSKICPITHFPVYIRLPDRLCIDLQGQSDQITHHLQQIVFSFAPATALDVQVKHPILSSNSFHTRNHFTDFFNSRSLLHRSVHRQNNRSTYPKPSFSKTICPGRCLYRFQWHFTLRDGHQERLPDLYIHASVNSPCHPRANISCRWIRLNLRHR